MITEVVAVRRIIKPGAVLPQLRNRFANSRRRPEAVRFAGDELRLRLLEVEDVSESARLWFQHEIGDEDALVEPFQPWMRLDAPVVDTRKQVGARLKELLVAVARSRPVR